jgi:hypothetical protein
VKVENSPAVPSIIKSSLLIKVFDMSRTYEPEISLLLPSPIILTFIYLLSTVFESLYLRFH